MGADLGCATPAAAMDEIAALTPTFAGISHTRLDRDDALHWPCTDPHHPGQPVLYLDGFATPNGRAALVARPYLPPGERPDSDYPFVLVTGRRLVHYNTGSMTRRTPDTDLLPAETLDLNPTDTAALHLADGDLVTVTSRRGSITSPRDPATRSPPAKPSPTPRPTPSPPPTPTPPPTAPNLKSRGCHSPRVRTLFRTAAASTSRR
jgi:formate dehydrogenase major subunit